MKLFNFFALRGNVSSMTSHRTLVSFAALIVLALGSYAFAASTGVLEGASPFAGTCANPDNAISSNNSRAACEDGETVIAQNFDVSGVPSDAVHIGFKVTVEASADDSDGDDQYSVTLSSNTVSPVTVATNNNVTSTSDNDDTFPSSSDCSAFGHTWTVSELAGLKATVIADPNGTDSNGGSNGTLVNIDDVDVEICYIARTITEVDFQGVENQFNATVEPGDTIPTEVDVTVGQSSPWNSNSLNDWQSLYWQIGSGPNSTSGCDAGPNDTNSGNYTYGDNETFNITAPSVAGTYDLLLRAYNTNNCTGTEADQVFSGVITVENPAATLTLVKNLVKDNGGTASATDWTLSASGPTPISGTSGSGTVTAATVNPGTYTLSESDGPTGYDASEWVCTGTGTQDDSDSVTLDAGETATCTITNDDQPAQLTVVKHVVNDNNGTATAGNWTMNVTGANPSNASFAGAESGTTISLDAGAYSVDESGGPTGYTKSLGSDCSGTVSVGDTKTCTITNDDNAPQLTLIKKMGEIVYRGTASAIDWTLTAIGDLISPTNLSGTTPVVSGATFKADTYTLGETGPSGYNASSWACVKNGGATTTGSTIALGIGDIANCTITNSDKEPGILHVIKHVENDNPVDYRGTAVAGDFTLTVSGGNPSPASFAGSETGVDVTIDAGASYSVAETGGPTSLYGMSLSANCSGTMPEGGERTCTITNNDNPPTTGGLTVVKIVTNNNGGTKEVSDFPLFVGTVSVTSGASNQYAGGSYQVFETGDSYYAATFTGDCDGDGMVTVVNGESKTCTITNDDIAPQLTVIKTVVNDNGGTKEADDFTMTVDGTNVSDASFLGSESGTTVTLNAGSYSVNEVSPDGYAPELSAQCSGTIAIGESKTCTITNDDIPATLHIVKHVINDNGGSKNAGNFTLHVTGGSPSPASFSGSESGTDVTLNAGDYSVSEDVVAGYGVTLGSNCSGTIALGETKTCTVTNDDGKANLIIVKNTVGADGAFNFNITGHASTTITTVGNTGSTTIALDAGTYTISEDAVSGWTKTSASCSNDDSISEVTLSSGDTVTCTFTNRASGADLSVSKTVDDATADNGQNITFTLTAANAGPAAATGVTVHDAFPAGLTYVSDDGGGAYATSTGDWTIGTLPSASSTTLHITATVSGTAGQDIVNSASISLSDEGVTDGNSENNSSVITVTVNTPAPTPRPSGGGGNGPPVGSLGFGGSVLGASTSTGGQVLGASTSTCSQPLLTQYMRRGKKNDVSQVTLLQQFLNGEMGSGLPASGFFGVLTENAVKAFQSKYAADILAPWGLTDPTGYVFKTTLWKINMVNCPSLNLPAPVVI